MILQSLVRYYDSLLERDPDGIARFGWCMRRIAYFLELDADGSLLVAVPSSENGRLCNVPQRKKRSSGIIANALCDNSSYMLGVDAKGNPARAEKCFDAARKLHLELLSGIDSAAATAVRRFFETWDPSSAMEHPAIVAAGDRLLAGGELAFSFDGLEVVGDPAIQRAWDTFAISQGGQVARCLVTGEKTSIERLHPVIKGVVGAQSSGASLVSFNAPAFGSYGHDDEQGLNAPVGERAAFAYTTALNHLLSDPAHRVRLGDTTVVYWAERDDQRCSQLVNAALDPFGPLQDEGVDPEDQKKKLDAIMKEVARGGPLSNVDMEAPFCVLGLAPNAARISVRFFFRDTFGSVISNIARHYERIAIAHAPHEFEYLYPYQLLRELENPNAKKPVVSSQMGGSLMRAILGDAPYPNALLENALLRTRAARNDPDRHRQKVSRGRAAIMKACLIKNGKERITVGLDEERKDVPYILGRLFVAFEDIQYASNPDVRLTVGDRYLDAACATPSLVHSTLLGLARAHMKKVRREKPRTAAELERKIGRYLECLSDIPDNLSPKEQCLFYLGYYHQKQHDIDERARIAEQRKVAAQSKPNENQEA